MRSAHARPPGRTLVHRRIYDDTGRLAGPFWQGRGRRLLPPRYREMLDVLRVPVSRYDVAHGLLSCGGADAALKLRIMRDVAADLAEHEAPHVLEAGCGPAHLAIGIARLLPRAHVLGVEASPRTVALAAENARCAGVADRVRVEQGDIVTACYPHELDAIVSFAVMGALSEAEVDEFVARASRALRPGGKLYLADFCYTVGSTSTHTPPIGHMTVEEWWRDAIGSIGVGLRRAERQPLHWCCRNLVDRGTRIYFDAAWGGWWDAGDYAAQRIATERALVVDKDERFTGVGTPPHLLSVVLAAANTFRYVVARRREGEVESVNSSSGRGPSPSPATPSA